MSHSPAPPSAANSLAVKQNLLLKELRALQSCLIAFSGGVDSAVVAKAAHLALGERAIAVTGVSASLASGELELAQRVAAEIGMQHRVVNTSEQASAEYQRNNFDRCFHCKHDLYSHLDRLCEELQVTTIVNGANLDDLSDHRPGMRAAQQHSVRSPLAACGITKAEVRELARQWNLTVAEKPAMPCLASRVAYGEQVTPERMAMIDQAEQFLRQQGFAICRVRYHGGDIARVEVPQADLPALCTAPLRDQLIAHLKELGFRFVTIDLAGFRSGSLNVLAEEEFVRFS